ncbi:MAG: polyprenyl synthetase family protein [Rickettsiaceae bacterium]|nr:polyprenyl synthetase family protein [Rickettsiaceae bacterium]
MTITTITDKASGKIIPDLIKNLHQYLADDIAVINEVILQHLAVKEDLVKVIGNHITTSRGKRIRPILTILTAKMFGYKGMNDTYLAAAVELIHLATLLHDDVVDGSKMRRFLPTANVVWGNKASILVGDFLFSQSFKLIVATKSLQAMTILSKASAIICEGEISQLAKLEENRIITEDEYTQIINAKTAELFAASCEVGTIISVEGKEYSNIMRDFGAILGNIYQIADDSLDYFSNSSKVGKNIGDDFIEGKVTLPLILLHKKLMTKDQEKLITLIKSPLRTIDDFTWVCNKMAFLDIHQDIKQRLEKLKLEAFDYLQKIAIENESKYYLKLLLEFAINRSY